MDFSSVNFNNESLSATNQIVDFFKRELMARHLVPGEKIPSEMALAKSMNVSRGTVREAMKMLSSYGLVDVRRGDGTYICNSAQNISTDAILFSFLLSQPTKDEQVEFRWYIEKNVLELAIKNATSEDITLLENNYNELLTLESAAETFSNDIEFHHILGNCTHNRLLAKVYDFAMNYCRVSLESSHIKNKGSAARDVHRKTIDAIRKKNLPEVDGLIKAGIQSWSNDSDDGCFGE